MSSLKNLSDDEIDALLISLFKEDTLQVPPSIDIVRAKSIESLSNAELLRIRSRNHPDKWPNVNQDAYQEAVNELDRRRYAKSRE